MAPAARASARAPHRARARRPDRGHRSCARLDALAAACSQRLAADSRAVTTALAEAVEQHEADRARPSTFLSMPMSSSMRARADARRGRPAGPRARAARARARTSARGEPARARADSSRRQHHAAADRLAVQPVAVAGARLDRVAEGVAEVQQRAPALLALVLGDDRGLDLAGAAHRVRRARRVARAAARRRCASSQSKNAASAIERRT